MNEEQKKTITKCMDRLREVKSGIGKRDEWWLKQSIDSVIYALEELDNVRESDGQDA